MNQDRNGQHRSSGNSGRNTKAVFAITERGDKSYWTRVGVAYTNRNVMRSSW